MVGLILKQVGQSLLGLSVGNLTEWVFHKHVLHGLGKQKGSIWNFHWYKHHKQCRKQMIDPDYQMGIKYLMQTPEFIVLSTAMWFMFKTTKNISPFFAASLVAYGFLYYFIHMRSHLDQSWAEKWIPWHVDHHQKGNQEHSFNVVFPLFDYLLGTNYKPKN